MGATGALAVRPCRIAGLRTVFPAIVVLRHDPPQYFCHLLVM